MLRGGGCERPRQKKKHATRHWAQLAARLRGRKEGKGPQQTHTSCIHCPSLSRCIFTSKPPSLFSGFVVFIFMSSCPCPANKPPLATERSVIVNTLFTFFCFFSHDHFTIRSSHFTVTARWAMSIPRMALYRKLFMTDFLSQPASSLPFTIWVYHNLNLIWGRWGENMDKKLSVYYQTVQHSLTLWANTSLHKPTTCYNYYIYLSTAS